MNFKMLERDQSHSWKKVESLDIKFEKCYKCEIWSCPGDSETFMRFIKFLKTRT